MRKTHCDCPETSDQYLLTMKNPLCIILGLWLIIFCTKGAQAQYVLNGNAVKESCNCYVLTPDQQTQSGSVWQATKINLNIPFDFTFEV